MATRLEGAPQLPAPVAADKDRRRSHHRQLPLQLGERAGRIERDGDGPASEDSEVGDDERGRRRQQKRHALTGNNPVLPDVAPHRPGLCAHFAIGELAPAVAQRHGGAGMTLDDGGQIHGRLSCGRLSSLR